MTTWHEEFYLYVATLPSAETFIRQIQIGSTSAAMVSIIGSSGALRIRDSAGTLYTSPAGKRLTAGNWVKVVWDVAQGSQRLQWFADGASTATDDSTVVASNVSGAFTAHRRGAKCQTSATTSDLYFDDEVMTGTIPDTGPALGAYIWNGTEFVHHVANIWDGAAWHAYDANTSS